MNLKPLFIERMQQLLKEDFNNYIQSLKVPSVISIRCNTLKISPSELKKRLTLKNWKLNQPWKEHEEAMTIESELLPGQLGRALEHQLGYYYVQDLASMLPIIALQPKPNETILDLCASPGSKTTQTASHMQNKGKLIANEMSLSRIKILSANLERCGVSNCAITRKEGTALCKKLKDANIKFSKILLDAPCSGEGTLRNNPKTSIMWNINSVKSLSNMQKNLLKSAVDILEHKGELIYSTCTHSPEKNEEVIDFALKNLNVQLEKISLPVKTRPGLTEWRGKKFSGQLKLCHRIYPHENNTEGFFVAKLRKK